MRKLACLGRQRRSDRSLQRSQCKWLLLYERIVLLPYAAVQKQGDCSACVGFAVTAAAEAAINVYKQQSWQKLNLSEQDFCFCK
jgi:C1A family cysteine protease